MIEKLFKVSESSDLSTFSSESKKGESDVQFFFPILMLIPSVSPIALLSNSVLSNRL